MTIVACLIVGWCMYRLANSIIYLTDILKELKEENRK
jgi:hypothetical protein